MKLHFFVYLVPSVLLVYLDIIALMINVKKINRYHDQAKNIIF